MNVDDLMEKIVDFDWDEGNINKSFVKHGITNKESEQTFFNFKQVLPDSLHSFAEQRHRILGVTDKGKILSSSFTVRGKKIRIISSRLASKRERSNYEKAQKNSQI